MNYDLSTIQSAFVELIKFKMDYNVSNLDADLIGKPSSGKYYNIGVNPLITLRNIESLMPLSGDMNIDAWDGAITYSKNDAVLVSSVYYRSLTDSNLNNAVSDTANWAVTSLLSIWIRSRLYSMFEIVLANSMLANKLFDHVKMYNIADNDDTLTNESKFVGFEIRPKNSEHLKIVLNRIATQFSETQSSLNLYLYKQNTLVSTIELSSLTAKEFAFTNTTDEELIGEGRWFLYYDQDDLSGSAYNWPIFNQSTFTSILPFEVANTTTDFVNDVNSYNSNSYGLGLDYSVYGNLTNFILDNKQAFIETMHLQWQYDILELFQVNPEVRINLEGNNIDREKISEYIIGELKSENKNSLVSKLNTAYKALKKSIDFNEIALPGENEQTITYNSYG